MGNTTRTGDGANDTDHSDPIRNGDAFETTNYSGSLSDEKDTPTECRFVSTDVYIRKVLCCRWAITCMSHKRCDI